MRTVLKASDVCCLYRMTVQYSLSAMSSLSSLNSELIGLSLTIGWSETPNNAFPGDEANIINKPIIIR